MSNAPDIPTIPRERAVALTAWFSVLMHSARAGHIRAAREARQQLERQGVVVHFLPGKEADHAAP